jgi:type IV pilus assembly protein PilY1
MNPELLLRCLRAAACAFAALAGGAALAQKIDDVPPEVQNNVPPNFMFMIDNSGSMSNIVPSAPYSATATYTASCTSNVVPASTPTVDIRVVSGEPRFSYGGNIYRHTSTTSGREDVRCFDNNATYNARLLADNAVSGGRSRCACPRSRC